MQLRLAPLLRPLDRNPVWQLIFYEVLERDHVSGVFASPRLFDRTPYAPHSYDGLTKELAHELNRVVCSFELALPLLLIPNTKPRNHYHPPAPDSIP